MTDDVNDVIANRLRCTGAGITRANVKQLMLCTGAREVHVGSACQESVPTLVPRQGAAIRLGFVAGAWVAGLFGAMLCTPTGRLIALFILIRKAS